MSIISFRETNADGGSNGSWATETTTEETTEDSLDLEGSRYVPSSLSHSMTDVQLPPQIGKQATSTKSAKGSKATDYNPDLLDVRPLLSLPVSHTE